VTIQGMEHAELVRTAYRDAAGAYVAVVDGIDPDQWALPSIGEWTVRELVAHAARALVTVETYLGQPAEQVDLTSSAAYFAAGLAPEGIHDDVARRARDQADALGPDLRTAVTEVARRVLALVDDTPDDAVLGTFVGGIRLVDYLPSRVVELVVHTLDLTDALSAPPVLPPTAAQVALATLAEVGASRPAVVDAAALVRALTGRAPLPGDFNVLG
jgi:uncharacterized protein (TIGR03083 family)